MSVCSVCVCEDLSFTYVIESIDSILISVCLINDHSLIAELHIFVYGSAECATISLECKKVKLLILNNFNHHANLGLFKFLIGRKRNCSNNSSKLLYFTYWLIVEISDGWSI